MWESRQQFPSFPQPVAPFFPRPGSGAKDGQRLAGNLTSRYDTPSAEVGMNLVYAPSHQFGAKQGKFGSTRSSGTSIRRCGADARDRLPGNFVAFSAFLGLFCGGSGSKFIFYRGHIERFLLRFYFRFAIVRTPPPRRNGHAC